MLGSEESLRYLRDRIGVCYVVVIFCFSTLLMRIFYLQILKGVEFKQFSEENYIQKQKVPAPRGMIFDRAGTVLVDNVPSFDVSITPQFVANLKETVKKVSELLKVPEEELNAVLIKNKTEPSFYPRIVMKDVSRDIVALVSHHKLDLPGVDIEMRIKRMSRVKTVGAQLLGYVGEISREELNDLGGEMNSSYQRGDIIGKDGLENQLEQVLRGKDGRRLVLVDARGRRKNLKANQDDPFDFYPETNPEPGRNVKLTIDQELQEVADKAFEDKIGAAVVLDLATGAVLSMISRPSYDPTIISLGLDRDYYKSIGDNPFFAFGNKAVQTHQPPGSTFKVITAIAGLEEKIVTKDTRFYCGGQKRFGRRVLHCHAKGGHGEVNLHSAIVKSCNIYFYNVASKLSIDTLAKYATMFNLGRRINIGLKKEIPGFIPTAQWKLERMGEPWQDGETLSVAIGQGFALVTPIQQAVLYGAIANGGFLLSPYLVKEITSPFNDQVLFPEPVPVRQQVGVQAETLGLIRKALAGVVNEQGGTMWWRRLPDNLMAGKTGTSQVKKLSSDEIYGECEVLPFKERRHAWFVGFAPAENPEISFAVLAEHACHGSSGAGAIAREIVKAYFDKKAREAGKTASIEERGSKP